MGQKLSEIHGHVHWHKENEVAVFVGPYTARGYKADKIDLDGRHYVCSGVVIFKNGLKLRANFHIQTHTADFLERNSVRVLVEKNQTVYGIEEVELFEFLGIKKEDAFPYRWQPDRPLNYGKEGPYPMKWPEPSDINER